MIKWYIVFIGLFYLQHGTLYSQRSNFDEVIELADAQNCEAAITKLAAISTDSNTEELEKKLQAFLSIGSECDGKEFRSRTTGYLDSIIQHPRSIEFPKIARAAHFKKDVQIFNIEKSLTIFQSLEKIEEQAGTDSTLAACYVRLADIYSMQQNTEAAKSYYKKALELSLNKKDKRKTYIGLAKAVQDDPVYSDSLFKLALDLSHQIGDSMIISSSLNLYGKFLRSQGKFDLAVDHLIQAVNMLPQKKMLNLLRMRIHTDISQLFLQLSNYKRAEEYIQQAIIISEANNFKARNGLVAAHYGSIALETNRLDLAKVEFRKAFEFEEKKKSLNAALGSLSLLGEIALKEEDEKMAAHYHFKGLKIMEQVKSNANKNRFYTFSGKRYLKMGNLKKAKQTYQALQDWAIASNRPSSQITALLKLSEISEKRNEFKDALTYYQAYNTLSDSIFRSGQNKVIFDIESKYKRAEQDKEIALLDAENLKKQSVLSQQKIIISIGGIALALISLLSFFLFRLFKKVNAQKVKLSTTLSEKDTLLREIHHRVKNNLQLISSLLSLQSRHISDPNALEALNSGKSRVKSMALIHQDLYNRENLTGVSVKTYLEKLCKELISTYQIDTDRVTLHTNIPDLFLDVDTLVPLGLIINELLTNAMKYAFPDNRKGRIDVKLSEIDGQLQLIIKDNGIGIDPDKKSDASFGYKLIDTLLFQLQGNLKRENINGTHLFITFNQYKIAA